MIQLLENVHNRKKSTGDRLASGLSAGVGSFLEHYQNKQEQEKTREQSRKFSKELNIPDISDQPLEIQKAIFSEAFKQQGKSNQIAKDLQSNKAIISDLEQRRGLEPGSLKAYESNPSMAEKVTKESKKTQSSQPIDPEQLDIIKKTRVLPEYETASPLKKYQILTDNGVSKENAEAESKIAAETSKAEETAFENSYKAQQSFIDETTDKYKGFETEMKPRLLQMQNMDPDDLVSPTSFVFLESLGIPLGALEDPSSELYHKLSQDLLKGLPETYGSRILKVEVDNFLKTIPTLLNSADGRRMIASNMLKLGEMKEIYYNEMRKQQKESLDNRKPLARDFQQRIFDQVKPQIDRINNEFVKMSEVKSVPKGTIPFFGPDGNVSFVPKEHAQWASENGGRRIW